LFTNHRQHTASSTLYRQRKRRLHTENCLKIATFLQLHQHLILVADILSTISLRLIGLHKVKRQSFYINIIRIIKAGIHPFSSNVTLQLLCIGNGSFPMAFCFQ